MFCFSLSFLFVFSCLSDSLPRWFFFFFFFLIFVYLSFPFLPLLLTGLESLYNSTNGLGWRNKTGWVHFFFFCLLPFLLLLSLSFSLFLSLSLWKDGRYTLFFVSSLFPFSLSFPSSFPFLLSFNFFFFPRCQRRYVLLPGMESPVTCQTMSLDLIWFFLSLLSLSNHPFPYKKLLHTLYPKKKKFKMENHSFKKKPLPPK